MEIHETSWNSLLTVSSALVDQNMSFSPAKIKSLKQIASRLPTQGSKDVPNTPGTLTSNVERRRKLRKFGKCSGQQMGKVEPLVRKMPKMKLRYEPKFQACSPASPKNTQLKFDLPININAKMRSINPEYARDLKTTSSPRTPRAKIRCRHCGEQHWSHSCPNRKVSAPKKSKPDRSVFQKKGTCSSKKSQYII